MDILKNQSTLTIAVWSSVLLHTVGFLGFGLAFSNRKESFPKSEPRTVSIVSISSVSNPMSLPEKEAEIDPEKSIQNKILKQSFSEISEQKELELQDKITEKSSSSEIVSNSITLDSQEDNASNFSGDGGPSGNQKGVILSTEPIPLNSIEPEYPFRARKKGLEGVVIIDVVISNSGEPLSCQIADSSGYKDLDTAAKKSVLSSLFQPGTLNGEDIESTLRISISFLLNKS